MGEGFGEQLPQQGYEHEFLRRLNIEIGDTIVTINDTRRRVDNIIYGEFGEPGRFEFTTTRKGEEPTPEVIDFVTFINNESSIAAVEKAGDDHSA